MKRQCNNIGRTFKSAFTSALSVFLCVVMLSVTVFTLSGCKVVDGITNGFNVNQKFLPESELARLIVNAISGESHVAESYAAIPTNQMNELAYSTFSEYCSILRKCSQAHGTISSFRFLNEEEKQSYIAQVDTDAKELDDFAGAYETVTIYGDMDIVELRYVADRKPESPVRFPIAKVGDNCYVAKAYIEDSIYASYYFRYYFEMIEDRKIDGIKELIKPKYIYDPEIYTDEVIDAKALSIVDYYELKVKSSTDGFEISMFTPTHITYVVPDVLSPDGKSLTAKTVDLRKTKNGEYLFEDKLPQYADEIRLRKPAGSSLRFGSTYSEREIRDRLGDPICIPLSEGVKLNFGNLSVFLEGSEMTDSSEDDGRSHWTPGVLSSVKFRKNGSVGLGSMLAIGMSKSELLLLYPTIDDYDYRVLFSNEDAVYEISFEFDKSDKVALISIEEAT